MLVVGAMSSARHIALWLAAVIVTIAAAIMPCAALAHEGHGHDRAAKPIVVAGERSVHTLDTVTNGMSKPFAAIASFSNPEAGKPLRSAGNGNGFEIKVALMSVGTSRLACACLACLAGTICGHASSSCCATGIAPGPEPLCAPPTVLSRLARRDGLPMPGIVPESLGEPPRSSA